MTVSRKAALSLFIAVLLVTGFVVLASTGLFNLVEARFYNPSITSALTSEINRDTGIIQHFFSDLDRLFSASLQEDAARRSFLPTQRGEDVFERTRLYGMLLGSLGGLESVRFVDADGGWIHYSTLDQDILRQDARSVMYRRYGSDPGDLPYETLGVSAAGASKITFDGARIVFSFPFFDALDIYRGTALFTLSSGAIGERLVTEGRLQPGETVSLVGSPLEPQGLLFQLPKSGRAAIPGVIAPVWKQGILTLTNLDLADSDAALSLISGKTSQGIFVGRLVDEGRFVFPQGMKYLLVAAIFLTLFLTIFLLFNLRQDSMTIVRNRLNRLQSDLIEEYDTHHNAADWSRDLEQRREEVRSEVKRGIKAKAGTRRDIDSLIDTSWNELLAIIRSRESDRPGTVQPEPFEEAEAIPELEAADGDELLEELEPAGGAPESGHAPERDIAALTSQIEFSPVRDAEEEAAAFTELEISSPFSTLLSEFSPGEEAPVEELTAYPLSLVYTPFTGGNDNPQELEAAAGDAPVIEEREGVNYIDRRVFAPDRETEQSLDPAFKSLIDSVIRRN
jgi:hypothetical protein